MMARRSFVSGTESAPTLAKSSAIQAFLRPRTPGLASTCPRKSSREQRATRLRPKLRDWEQMKWSAAATRSSNGSRAAKSSQVRAGLVMGIPSRTCRSEAPRSTRRPTIPLRTGRFPPSHRNRCTSGWPSRSKGRGQPQRIAAVRPQHTVPGERPVKSLAVCVSFWPVPQGTRTPRLATRRSLFHARLSATPAARCSERVNDLPLRASGRGPGLRMHQFLVFAGWPGRLSTVWRRGDSPRANRGVRSRTFRTPKRPRSHASTHRSEKA